MCIRDRIVASGNEITIASTDVMNIDVVDALRTKLDSMPLPPPLMTANGREEGVCGALIEPD